MVGIILAGGSGTRLLPLTYSISKQLLPIYDKPMIYYPLSVLMLANIKEILIITDPVNLPLFKKLLGDGSRFGISLTYKVQESPNGIAEAFILGEDFIGNNDVALMLGDNILWGQGLSERLTKAQKNLKGATIFGYRVSNPKEFGVVEISKKNKIKRLIEKPKKPKSNIAVTGLYMFENDVTKVAKLIKPSERGEKEITDVNNYYLKQSKLKMEFLGRGFAWLDTGTHESLIDAGNFVNAIEKRQGYKIACLEEVAFNKKWIDKNQLKISSKIYGKSDYASYLKNLE